MDRQVITGGNGTSGQTGEQIKDIINENFTDLYVSMAPDYVISKSGSTITAKAREGTGLDDYSGTDAYTVIQAAITALTPDGAPGSGGGHIHLSLGVFTLTNELVINGWEGITFALPQSSIRITGSGYGTKIVQNTSAKNAFVFKNNCTPFVSDMWIETGANAYSAILFDDTGADTVQAVHVGELNRLMLYGQSTARPTLHLKNFFNINCPLLVVYGLSNTAVKLEGTSTLGNFGNSTFGHLKLIGGEGATDCGLHLIGTQNNRPMNLCTFDNVEMGQGEIGIHLENATLNTFKMIIIEGVPKPIKVTGASSKSVRNNTFLSGLIEPRGVGRVGLLLNQFTGNNYFNLVITSDGTDGAGDAAMTLVDDENTANPPNTYNLTLDAGFTPTTKITVDSDHTLVTYREASNGETTFRVPPVSVSDNDLSAATTQMLQFRAYYERDVTPFQILGSGMKAQTLGSKIDNASGTPYTLVDQRLLMCPVWLPNDITLTGIGFIIRTNGSYTGDEYNGVGLYTYDDATGLCTRVALSTNDATLWAGGANTIIKKAFSGTYVATRGMYVVGVLYNNSAQTTAPTIANTDSANAVMQTLDFANSAKLCGTANTHIVLPTTINMSALTANAACPWFMLY